MPAMAPLESARTDAGFGVGAEDVILSNDCMASFMPSLTRADFAVAAEAGSSAKAKVFAAGAFLPSALAGFPSVPFSFGAKSVPLVAGACVAMMPVFDPDDLCHSGTGGGADSDWANRASSRLEGSGSPASGLAGLACEAAAVPGEFPSPGESASAPFAVSACEMTAEKLSEPGGGVAGGWGAREASSAEAPLALAEGVWAVICLCCCAWKDEPVRKVWPCGALRPAPSWPAPPGWPPSRSL